jgi:small GTP-binding protein
MSKNYEIPEYEILSQEINEFDYSYKIIIIGDSSVGKSCLTIRAAQNIFLNDYKPTVGFEICNLNLKIKEKNIKLQIWDTCGQEKYRALITSFYHKSSLVIIVYSIDDRDSYKNIDQWLNEIKSNTRPDIKIFLIGNKSDLEESRQISKEEAQHLCEERELTYFIETSAKKGDNVISTFVLAANMLLEETLNYYNINTNLKTERTSIKYAYTNYVEDEPSNIILDNTPKEKRNCCICH